MVYQWLSNSHRNALRVPDCPECKFFRVAHDQSGRVLVSAVARHGQPVGGHLNLLILLARWLKTLAAIRYC